MKIWIEEAIVEPDFLVQHKYTQKYMLRQNETRETNKRIHYYVLLSKPDDR